MLKYLLLWKKMRFSWWENKVFRLCKSSLKDGMSYCRWKVQQWKNCSSRSFEKRKKIKNWLWIFSRELTKKRRNERYHLIHETVYTDAIKMFSSKYFPDVAFLQEDALIIKNVSSKKGIRWILTLLMIGFRGGKILSVYEKGEFVEGVTMFL